MDFVTRLFVREELNALELELADAKRAHEPDFARIQNLTQEIARLEAKLRGARTGTRRAG